MCCVAFLIVPVFKVSFLLLNLVSVELELGFSTLKEEITTDSNGFKYSKTAFDGYKSKGVFDLSYRGSYGQKVKAVAIYTDNPDRKETREFLFSVVTPDVFAISTIIWNTNG